MDVLNEEVKEFQQRLEAILKEFLERGRIEVYGNLRTGWPFLRGIQST
jgi:hypothetical protein